MDPSRPTFGRALLTLVPEADTPILTAAGWTFDEYSSGYPSFTRDGMVLTFYEQMTGKWSVRFDFDEEEAGSAPTISGAMADAIANSERRIARFREELARVTPGGET